MDWGLQDSLLGGKHSLRSERELKLKRVVQILCGCLSIVILAALVQANGFPRALTQGPVRFERARNPHHKSRAILMVSRNNYTKIGTHDQDSGSTSSDAWKVMKRCAGLLFSALGAIGIATAFKYGKLLWKGTRWYTCPTSFQVAAKQNGIMFTTYFYVLDLNGISDEQHLVETSEEQLEDIAKVGCRSREVTPPQVAKLHQWRRNCAPAVYKATKFKYAPGLVDLSESGFYRNDFTILLIGQTGKGKTALLNLLAALGHVVGDLSEEAMTHFKNCCVAEEGPQQHMESMTHACTHYNIKIGPVNLSVIDSPGFGDTAGSHKDVENEANIIAELAGLGKIHCVLVVLSASDARLGPEMKVALRTIAAFVPRDIMTSFVFMCTNCPGPESKSFRDETLVDLFPTRQKPRVFCIDNPHSLLLRKFPGKSHVENSELIYHVDPRMLVQSGIRVIEELLDEIKLFTGLASKRFQDVQQEKLTVEAEITRITDAVRKAGNMRQRMQEDCDKLECYGSVLIRSSCMKCGWTASLNFRSVCPSCNHSIAIGWVYWDRPSPGTVSQKKKFWEPRIQELDLQIEGISASLQRHLDEYQRLNIPGAYLKLLRDQRDHFNSLIESSVTFKSLQRCQKQVLDRLAVVEESCSVQESFQEAERLLTGQIDATDVTSESGTILAAARKRFTDARQRWIRACTNAKAVGAMQSAQPSS